MGSRSTGGRSDQRPVTWGGPVRAGRVGRVGAAPRPPSGPRRPAYRVRRGPLGVRRWAVRPPASRARTGAKVSPVTRPDHARSQRVVASGGVVGGAHLVGQRAEEVGAAAGERVEHGEPLGGGHPVGVGPGQGDVRRVGQVQRDPAVVAGQRPVAAPEHLARGHQLVEQGGGVVGDPGGQHERLDRAGRQHRTAQLLDRRGPARRARAAAHRRPASPAGTGPARPA